MNAKKAAPDPPKHRFDRDTTIPEDIWGRQRCCSCGVMGKPGDRRHTDAEHPEVPEDDRSDKIAGG